MTIQDSAPGGRLQGERPVDILDRMRFMAGDSACVPADLTSPVGKQRRLIGLLGRMRDAARAAADIACGEVRDVLELYVDLPPAERAQKMPLLAEHFAECEDCRICVQIIEREQVFAAIALIGGVWQVIVGNRIAPLSDAMRWARISLGASGIVQVQPVPAMGEEPLALDVEIEEIGLGLAIVIDSAREVSWSVQVSIRSGSRPDGLRVGVAAGDPRSMVMQALGAGSSVRFSITPPEADGLRLTAQWVSEGQVKESRIDLPVFRPNE